MTTTKSINTTNYISGCTAIPPKPLSRVERTKSFLKASLIKKWKSSKELFTKPLANFTNSDHSKSASRKQLESQLQNGKFINEKVLDNLDEFERNFLLSAGRKILVRELRKNFEKPQNIQQHQQQLQQQQHHQQQQRHQSCGDSNKSGNGIVITVNGSTGGPVERRTKESNLRANSTVSASERPRPPQKKMVNASVQTSPDYENISYETKNTQNEYNQPKKCPAVTRGHSFYNTYRNEYCAWQTPSHYASNLSLISCGIPSNRERCLEKTINKYNNSIRSSSAVDLSSISAVVLNSAMPTTLKRQYSSIINISHSNSSQNLTDSPIIDYDYGSLNVSTSYAIYENTKSVQNNSKNNNNNNNNYNNQNNNNNINNSNQSGDNCHQVYNKPTVATVASSTMLCDSLNNNANVNIHFRNGDYDTKSMIVSSTTAAASIVTDPLQNACHFNRCTSKSDLHGSNVSLTIVNTNDDADSHNIYSNICSNNKMNQCTSSSASSSSSANCHNRNLNNKNILNNSPHHDGNNNNTTTKIRKCHSINQIDLGLLKNELDEYIDRDLRISTNFGRNTLAQRRCQFEHNLKKVINYKLNFESFVWTDEEKKNSFFKSNLINCKYFISCLLVQSTESSG